MTAQDNRPHDDAKNNAPENIPPQQKHKSEQKPERQPKEPTPTPRGWGASDQRVRSGGTGGWGSR